MSNSKKENIFIEVTVTNDCNCNCTYCFEKCSSKKQIIIENYESCVLTLLEKACVMFDQTKYEWLTISFWGGEPLMNFDFLKQIIEKTYQYTFVRYHLYSNGMLTNEFKKLICQKFFNSIKDRIHIQLSYDGNPHNLLKRGNDGQLTFNTADLLYSNDVKFDFKATLSYDLIKNLPEIWDSYFSLYKKYGDIVCYYPTLDTSESPIQYFDDWKKSLLIVFKKEFKFILQHKRALWGWLNTGEKKNCNLNNSIHIHTDGNIYICHGCAYKNNDKLKYNNIYNIDSLNDVISNEFNITNIPEQCQSCPATYCCVCHIEELNTNDDIHKSWVECKVNNKIRCNYFKYFGYMNKLLQVQLDNRQYMR